MPSKYKYAFRQNDVVRIEGYSTCGKHYKAQSKICGEILIPRLEFGSAAFPEGGIPVLSARGHGLKAIGHVPFNLIAIGNLINTSDYEGI
jgi:hypothetical protein